MVRLILMRHGSAAYQRGIYTHDRDRTLDAQGRIDVPRVAREVLRLGWSPTLALVSGARRTLETLELFVRELDAPIPTHELSSFYLGGADQILTEVLTYAEGHSCILAVGHNPGWSEAAQAWSGATGFMRPGEAVMLEHPEADWARAFATSGRWTRAHEIQPSRLP